jgi:hypothetical protein
MQIYNYSTFDNNLGNLLTKALSDEIIIQDYKGNNFSVKPVKVFEHEASPFEKVPCLNLNISTKKIVDIIREGREEN